MGNYLAILLGLLFMGIGAVLWWFCWEQFWIVLRGCIGFTLFFMGLLALVIGWSELRASREFERATTVSPPAPESSPTAGTSTEQKQ